MKKLERANRSIDYIKLFAEHSQGRGIGAYTQDAIREFGDQVLEDLTTSTNSEHRLRGLRAEALFLSVVAGIGKVQLIKAEDAGEVYFAGEHVRVPDFRVVTADAAQMLVEVKVHRLDGSFRSKFGLSDRYVRSLMRYSALTGCDLRIAIFWEEVCTWTLNRLESFRPGISGRQRWTISFPRAMATNEMACLGDVTIATLAPLRFRVNLDPEKSEPVPEGAEGRFRLVVSGVQLLSQDRILSGLAAKIAWKLIWYGKWVDIGQESHTEQDHLLYVDHLIGPAQLDDEEIHPSEPAMVGALSEMISKAYLRGANKTIHTTSKGDVLVPGYMGNFIPENFVALNLDIPLYVLEMRPNFDFVSNEDQEDS